MDGLRFLLPGLIHWGKGTIIIDVDRYLATNRPGSILLSDWPTEAEMLKELQEQGFQGVRKILLTRPEWN